MRRPTDVLHDLINQLEIAVKQMVAADYDRGYWSGRSSSPAIDRLSERIHAHINGTQRVRRGQLQENVDKCATCFLLSAFVDSLDCNEGEQIHPGAQLKAGGTFAKLLPALRSTAKQMDTAGNSWTGIIRGPIIAKMDLPMQVIALTVAAVFFEKLLTEDKQRNEQSCSMRLIKYYKITPLLFFFCGRPVSGSWVELQDVSVMMGATESIMTLLHGERERSVSGTRLYLGMEEWIKQYSIGEQPPETTLELMTELLTSDFNERSAADEEAYGGRGNINNLVQPWRARPAKVGSN